MKDGDGILRATAAPDGTHSARGVARWGRLQRIGLAAVVIMLVGLSVATGSGPVPTAARLVSHTASHVSGTLSDATATPPASLDPINGANSSVDEVDRQLYATLLQFSNGTRPVMQPDLATSWQISANGLTYTFHLRKGVHFHNGALFTSADAVFTLNRIKALGIDMATEISTYASSKADGPNTLIVHLTVPYRAFLGALSHVYILNSKLLQSHYGTDQGQAWLSDHDAGSGPYELTGYVAQSLISANDFPGYWGGWSGKHIAKLEWNYIGGGASVLAGMESGQYNFTGALPATTVATFDGKPGFTVNLGKTDAELYVALDTASGIMSNPTVRKAAAEAMNYTVFLKKILNGYGSLATGPLPAGMPCESKQVPTVKYNLAAAKNLISQAGATGKSASLFYIPVNYQETLGEDLLAPALTQIGLNVVPQGISFTAYVQELQNASTVPDMAFVFTYPLFPDPNEVLNMYFNAAYIATGSNYSRLASPQIDELLGRAAAITSIAKACPLYVQAEQMIAKTYATINVVNIDYPVVLAAGVHGYVYNVAHIKTENAYDMYIS